ncbi:UDP-N-acetylglucosamine 2-epimerase [Pseudodesulfovibrio karagichevae]|uniref:UDP-N-acetylglucosamine 2-epimerase n=1 Tax=Pseudodesulfovibrio karagichevae TaxID=3239305 RepID=A0ABV4K670_9BACT
MKKRKVCIVLTSRGNYAKMLCVMRAIEASPNLELQLIVGGGLVTQKHGYKIFQYIKEEFTVHRIIHFLVEGENMISMAKSSGLALSEFATAFDDLKPDMVIVIADRFECLPIAMAATYMNIPLVHIEGGEVSGSIDESIRHAITKMAHLHFPATHESALRIERLGEPAESIFAVGSTSLDAINTIDCDDPEPFRHLQEEVGVGGLIDFSKPYLLVIQHPVTTEYDDNRAHVDQTLAVIEGLDIQTAWIWPNMDAGSDGISTGIRSYREERNPPNIRFYKGLPIQFFAPLLKKTACFVGNSSSGIRESSFLGVPCVNIGARQAGRERASNVVDVPYEREAIKRGILQQLAHGHYPLDTTFGDGKASEKIVEKLGTYDFVIQKRITY